MFNTCKHCKLSKQINNNIKRLSDLEVGDEATVMAVAGADELRIKIMEMGIIANTPIKVIKKAPLGDPIAVLVRDYDLTLRKSEAEVILINKH